MIQAPDLAALWRLLTRPVLTTGDRRLPVGFGALFSRNRRSLILDTAQNYVAVGRKCRYTVRTPF